MKEEISALVDDELDRASTARAVDAVLVGTEGRDVWFVYQLIGDTLRGEPTATGQDAQTRFAERLAIEPTVLCPGTLQRRVPESPVAWPAAAAVAGIAVVVWAALGVQPERSISMATIDPVSRVSTVTKMSGPGSAGEEYLLAHQAVSPSGVLSGFSHYARTVAAVRVEGATGR